MTREHGVDPFDDDAAAPERAARLVRTAAAPEDRITLTDEQEAVSYTHLTLPTNREV